MDNKRIFELIRNLGLALTDYDHVWTNELRKEYEEVTTYLSSYLKLATAYIKTP